MYDEAKKRKIVESLLVGTESGYIKWYLKNSCFNSDTRHKMEYLSSDGLTRFDIGVTLYDNLLSVNDNGAYLYVNNNDLVDGSLQLSSMYLPDVKILQELIYDKFIKPNISKNLPKSDVLDSIESNISKQHNREEKIDDILKDVDLLEPNKETTSGRTEEEVIKEFLRKQEELPKKKKKYWLF